MKPGLLSTAFVLLIPLAAYAQSVTPYAHTFGGPGSEEGVDAGLDAAGKAYVIGTFRDTVDFDPGPGTASLVGTHEDVYVVSFDAAGAFRFAFQLGNAFASSEGAGGIAVDEAGAFVVTGSQPFGTIDYDPDPNATEERTGELFVAGYDTDGGFRFAVTAVGANPAAFGKGHAVVLDAAGHIYVTGQFTSTLVFDRGAEESDSLTSAGSVDLFVAGYTADGTYRFAFRLGGTGADYGRGIAVDGAGNVYVTGEFSGTMAFDPDDTDGNGDLEERTSAGGTDVFLASYTATGDVRFAYALGDTSHDIGYRLAVDAADNLYLTGEFSGTVAFDPDDTDDNGNPEERTAAGNGSAFLASYTADGAFRFAVVPPGGSSSGRALVTDAAGVSFVTGRFTGTVDFDPGSDTDTLSSVDATDVFVASYDATGAYRSAFALGGTHFSGGTGIALGADQLLLTGAFYQTIDLDPGAGVDERISAGQNDLFIATYPAELLVATDLRPAEQPVASRLTGAYPNPFAQQTSFTLALPEPQHVRVAVYDLLGRRVALLHDGMLPAGDGHRFTFDGAGRAAGMYLLQVEGEQFQETLRAVLIK